MGTVERWVKIKGFENYRVSSLGRVLSVDYAVLGKDGVLQNRKGRLLSNVTLKVGYERCSLRKDGKTFQKYVHDLVCVAFVGTKIKGLQVNHIDGNKLNNKACNLELCTPSQNLKHAYDTGLKEKKFRANQWVDANGAPTGRTRLKSKYTKP